MKHLHNLLSLHFSSNPKDFHVCHIVPKTLLIDKLDFYFTPVSEPDIQHIFLTIKTKSPGSELHMNMILPIIHTILPVVMRDQCNKCLAVHRETYQVN